MKKITRSFLAVSLSTAMIFQNMVLVSNCEEINTTISEDTYISSKSIDNQDSTIQPDPEVNPHRSMGDVLSTYSLQSELPDLETKTLTKASSIGFGKVTANKLNVRSGPSTSYSIVGTLNNGENVEILGRDNNWYKISYDNLTGYVSASYITLSPIEKGIDVSKWNGTIDWKKVKADGIDYVIIRGGFGNATVDPQFESYIQGASDAGLKIGVYWFSYATSVTKAKEEAAKCLETIAPYRDKITYPVFYDFEYDSVDYAKKLGITITKDLSSKMADEFLTAIKNAGYITGIYTNKDFGDKYFYEDMLFANNLWIAQYSSACTYNRPYMMWQYTDKGTINGIGTSSEPAYFDMNYTYLKPTNNQTSSNKIDLSSSSVSEISSKTYTGSAIEPSFTVTLNNKILKENEDYTVTYSNNISIGTAKILIKGIGNYVGEKTITFKIVAPTTSKINLSSASVSEISSKSYTGSAIKPSVTVKVNGKTLSLNKDYTVTYSNNISVGTAKILIKGTGNYTGEKTITFKIIPKKISKVSLSKKTTNSLTLSWNKLDDVTGYKIYKYDSKSEDYEYLKTIKGASTTSFTDSNLTDATVYKYKVRGYKTVDGNAYNGFISNSFAESTKVKTVSNLNLKTRNATSLELSWDKVKNADGYRIYRLDTNTDTYKLVKTINNNTTTSYKHSNLVSATNYYYKVKAFKYLNGSNRYSDYSSRLKATTRPLQPSVILNSTKSKSIKVSWTNISKRATGYEVRMSTSKNGTFNSIGTTTNTSFTKVNLTKGKTYYFKIRAYRIVDGQKIYSLYSGIESIKCK
ncbi:MULTISPECIES: GH25 family lysozyme [Terrisporobacter]|uniref:Fibronectin type III domain-containing protein n=1 Tax=Terrisporobacter muris TaxID=2963284 RepID=A0A9X2MD00_9FIRM|nr:MULTISPECIES: GH25 family lysozyme [Terrisporobacter]MCC3668343.1 fibronectin type III domain-containing protein [Terrisporobacter mayombei]MCR1823883.1 fibronectin type III domain-containing protein [Terrisporobacter muris]